MSKPLPTDEDRARFAEAEGFIPVGRMTDIDRVAPDLIYLHWVNGIPIVSNKFVMRYQTIEPELDVGVPYDADDPVEPLLHTHYSTPTHYRVRGGGP